MTLALASGVFQEASGISAGVFFVVILILLLLFLAIIWYLQRRSEKKSESADTSESAYPGTTAAPVDAPSDVAPEAGSDDLTQIKGIGPTYAQKLQAAGISTFAQLAALTASQLDDIIDAPDWRDSDYQDWIDQAKELSQS